MIFIYIVFVLKLAAFVCMFLDHLGAVLFPHVLAFRIVGRLAFPIFAYFVALGALRTRSPLRYFFRFFVCGACAAPFCWLLGVPNIIPSLASYLAVALLLRSGVCFGIPVAILVALSADFLGLEYGSYGFGVFLLFWWRRDTYLWDCLWIVYHAFFAALFVPLQFFAIFSPILIAYLSDRPSFGRLFYWLYPAHLALLAILYRFA